MSKITTITLDIETDKLPEFYISLALHKMHPKGNMEALKTAAAAIYLDHTALLNKLQLDEAKQKQIERSMLEIHAYLYNSKKDSTGYLEVSRESVSEFKASEFGKDLLNKLHLMELSRQWTGKADSMEVQVYIALYMFSAYVFVEVFNKAFSKSDVKKPLEIVHKKTDNREHPTAEASEQHEFAEETKAEYYIEKDGQILKVTEEEITENKNNTDHFFIKEGEDIVRLRRLENKPDEPEYTPFNNVKLIGNRLDFSHATAGEPYTVPIEPIIIEKTPKEINLDLYKIKVDTGQYQELVAEFKRFLRLPKGAREQTEVRNELLIDIYNSLTKHYSDLTIHVSTTITGYIGTRMGLMDTEELYNNTDRKQPYRKYLRDTVYNILKSHHLINN